MEIKIEPLVLQGETITPAFLLGDEINFIREQIPNSVEGPFFSAAQYLHLTPSLAELVHAYRTSEVFRQRALARRGRGEWTATLLLDGERLIQRPKLRYDEESRLWFLDDCYVSSIEVPPDGWVEEYNPRTGMPEKTILREGLTPSEARKRNISYFFAKRDGLYVVAVEHNEFENGLFYVRASYGLNDRIAYLGTRNCRLVA